MSDEKAISWTVFLEPFSCALWFAVLIVAVVISFALTFNERLSNFTDDKYWHMVFIKNLWISMKANAGGKPNTVFKNGTQKIVLFTCLFVGVVVWIAFRASFTSVLSVTKFHLPFNDLESLHKSNFRYSHSW